MPVKIPDALPATRTLTRENIFVMTEKRSRTQDIRPLRIAILNLMPTKEDTETQLLRLIGNSPLQVEITLLHTESYKSRHTDKSYLKTFYRTFSEVSEENFDGFVVTGAPVEQMDFESVAYWDELTRYMRWADTHAFSTLYICWAAQAALYYHYGVGKQALARKLFGVYDFALTDRRDRLLRGMDDVFVAPMSRHTRIDEAAADRRRDLIVLARSDEAGIALLRSADGRRVFCTGHSEYDRDTLAREYRRDVDKGLPIDVPAHYFPDDDPSQTPRLRWHAHANLLFANWLNYFVYQETPFELAALVQKEEEP